jgi:hypothetical protein
MCHLSVSLSLGIYLNSAHIHFYSSITQFRNLPISKLQLRTQTLHVQLLRSLKPSTMPKRQQQTDPEPTAYSVKRPNNDGLLAREIMANSQVPTHGNATARRHEPNAEASYTTQPPHRPQNTGYGNTAQRPEPEDLKEEVWENAPQRYYRCNAWTWKCCKCPAKHELQGPFWTYTLVRCRCGHIVGNRDGEKAWRKTGGCCELKPLTG